MVSDYKILTILEAIKMLLKKKKSNQKTNKENAMKVLRMKQ